AYSQFKEPTCLMCKTNRYHGQHVGDIKHEYYRSKQEEQGWKTERDPIQRLRDWLIKENLTDAASLDRIDSEAKTEIEKAVEFALAAPYPKPGEVDQDVYA